MDAAAALERLRDISSQVRTAVVFERGGKVLGSTLADEQRARQVADEAEALLTAVEQRGESAAKNEFAQLEVALQSGSVFVVRNGTHLIAATTSPEPTVGLVFYDLKSALRELEGPPPAPPKKRAPAKRKPAATKKKPDAKP